MIRIALALCLALSFPAVGQTLDDAARDNTLLGVELCVLHFLDGDTSSTAITQAGFAFAVVDGPPGDQTATYAAPADTATIDLYQGQTAPSCQVGTVLVGAPQIVPLVADMLDTKFPGIFQPNTTSGLCGAFTQTGSQIPLIVSIFASGEASGCPDNGTARIAIFFAV